jgi:hypothetical protein
MRFTITIERDETELPKGYSSWEELLLKELLFIHITDEDFDGELSDYDITFTASEVQKHRGK